MMSLGEKLKGEDCSRLIPINTYAIHNLHRPPVSRDMSSTDSESIAVTRTAAKYLQLSVEGKEKLFTCNNYNGVNSLK